MKNKEKYDLRNIAYVIDVNDYKYDFVIYHNSIEIYRENFDIFSPACSVFTKWLEEEYVPDILTDKEKAYLSAVIKPFRKDIKYIVKRYFVLNSLKSEYIYIRLRNDDLSFPNFKVTTMYKGMELDKRYTLKELGL